MSSTNTKDNNALQKKTVFKIEQYKHDIYLRDKFASITIIAVFVVVKRTRKGHSGVSGQWILLSQGYTSVVCHNMLLLIIINNTNINTRCI